MAFYSLNKKKKKLKIFVWQGFDAARSKLTGLSDKFVRTEVRF